MTAYSHRGALLLATVLLVVMPATLCAQGPTPSTNTGILRLLFDYSFLTDGVVAQRLKAWQAALPGGTDSVLSGGGAAAPAAGATRAGAPARAAAVRLPTLRPGATRSFLARQLDFPRVRRAYETKATKVTRLFSDIGVSTPEVFFRVFKREQLLEVWARDRGTGTYALLSTYPVCKLSGRLGPKRREGDLQIPEGFYEIDLLNPQSTYHLSMRVDYPNPVDRVRGAGGRLGGDIYIHGGCATIGCVPVTDEWIEELYLIAVNAHEAGQQTIPVHLFPTRLDDEGLNWLASIYGADFVDYPFWENLQAGYLAFERTRYVPAVGYSGARYTYPAPPSVVVEPKVAVIPGS